MATTAPFRIENLEVYRKSIGLGTRLYQSAGSHGANGNGNGAVGGKVRETALAMVLNLASGLGFWEKEWKAAHFAASKRAAMELTPLLGLMVALGEMKPEAESQYAGELQDLTRMIGGLLRQAQRREGEEDGGRREGAAADGAWAAR